MQINVHIHIVCVCVCTYITHITTNLNSTKLNIKIIFVKIKYNKT